MISYCRMEPGHPEWREFRRRMDQALSSMQCGAGPHDEAADKAKLDAIMNAPNFEEAIQIADTTVCDLFKVHSRGAQGDGALRGRDCRDA
jgi:hypothetical protein